MFKVSDEGIGFEYPDQTIKHIKRQVYLDFLGKSQFVAFFIPLSGAHPDRGYDACMQLVNHVQSTIEDLSSKTPIRAGDASSGAISWKDLTFSGRVFLYHEDPLSNVQKADIVNVYAAKHFDVQFRGPEYLSPKITEWFQKHKAQNPESVK